MSISSISSSISGPSSPTNNITPRIPHPAGTPPTSPTDLPPLSPESSSSGALLSPAASSDVNRDWAPQYPSHTRHGSGSGIADRNKGRDKGKKRSRDYDLDYDVSSAAAGHRRTVSVEETGSGGWGNSKLRPPVPQSGPGGWKRRWSGVGGVVRPLSESERGCERSGNGSGYYEGEAGMYGALQRVRGFIGMRVKKGLKKGNLPFIIIFIACLIIFFSALAGIGYMEPSEYRASSHAHDPEAAFQLGKPVFQGLDRSHGLNNQQIMAARRRMEEDWRRKGRPEDGAWMKKGRKDGAVRKKANTEAHARLRTEGGLDGDEEGQGGESRQRLDGPI